MNDRDLDDLLAAQARSYLAAGEGLRRSWPQAEALDRAGLRALLEAIRYGVLATSRPDGRAHAAPVAFSLSGGSFWIGSVEGRRLANLRRQPWASLVVMEGEERDHRALTVEGSVSVHEGEGFARMRRRLDREWSARHGHPPDWAAAMLELQPEQVFSHGARDA